MADIPSSEIVDAIYRLLPGFVTAWIFYGLTAHPKASSFERVIQALIFTLFVEALVQVIGASLVGIGSCTGDICGQWSVDNAFIWKVCVAILLGFVFAWFSNSSRFHNFLPDSLTKRTSYPSEWFGAFYQNPRFVYLNFADGRRIFGWPKEWPDAPGKGHFVLENAEWILPDNTRVALIAIEKILIPASDVVLVEFEREWDEVLQMSEEIQASSKIMVSYNQADNKCPSEDGDKAVDVE